MTKGDIERIERVVLTREHLMLHVKYDGSTGEFVRHNGRVAGTIDKGYVQIFISGTVYAAHRLAWLYVHGRMPKGQIDHINGIKNDNRISNLREVNHSGNQHNRWLPNKTNKLGFVGVYEKKVYKGKRYCAQIRVDGKKINLGYFESPELASEAYFQAKRDMHKFNGELMGKLNKNTLENVCND